MSNPQLKNEKNVPGPWFCTDPSDEEGEGCIACSECYSSAPEFFTADPFGHAYVKSQPSSPEDLAKCMAAKEVCPVNCIGNNG